VSYQVVWKRTGHVCNPSGSDVPGGEFLTMEGAQAAIKRRAALFGTDVSGYEVVERSWYP
jgi:hypothetical protein